VSEFIIYHLFTETEGNSVFCRGGKYSGPAGPLVPENFLCWQKEKREGRKRGKKEKKEKERKKEKTRKEKE
jgi:hypothetical protein